MCYAALGMGRGVTFVGCVAIAALVACASPTLPLPPPMAPEVSAGTDADHIKLTAGCQGTEAGAIIVIVNTNPSVPGDEAVGGAVADACGAWDADVYAHAGDLLQITADIGDTRSQPLEFQVPTP